MAAEKKKKTCFEKRFIQQSQHQLSLSLASDAPHSHYICSANQHQCAEYFMALLLWVFWFCFACDFFSLLSRGIDFLWCDCMLCAFIHSIFRSCVMCYVFLDFGYARKPICWCMESEVGEHFKSHFNTHLHTKKSHTHSYRNWLSWNWCQCVCVSLSFPQSHSLWIQKSTFFLFSETKYFFVLSCWNLQCQGSAVFWLSLEYRKRNTRTSKIVSTYSTMNTCEPCSRIHSYRSNWNKVSNNKQTLSIL